MMLDHSIGGATPYVLSGIGVVGGPRRRHKETDCYVPWEYPSVRRSVRWRSASGGVIGSLNAFFAGARVMIYRSAARLMMETPSPHQLRRLGGRRAVRCCKFASYRPPNERTALSDLRHRRPRRPRLERVALATVA